jgi:CheY-like chemotaxis protein
MDTATPSQRKRVLCVEDHPDICELITMILPEFEVISANSIGEAWDRFNTTDFALILLDYHLPDGTGAQLCEMVRRQGSPIPIIFVTGTSNLTESEARAAGAQKVIRKSSKNFVGDIRTAVDQYLAGPVAPI